MLGEIVHWHVEHVSGDLDGSADLPALNRLVDDFELLQEVRVEENVTVLVSVVGRVVALRDDLEHGGYHGQVVAVGRETRDGVDTEAVGVRDELGRRSKKHTLEGVTILETMKERKRVPNRFGDSLRVMCNCMIYVSARCDAHHKIIVGRTACLLRWTVHLALWFRLLWSYMAICSAFNEYKTITRQGCLIERGLALCVLDCTILFRARQTASRLQKAGILPITRERQSNPLHLRLIATRRVVNNRIYA